MGDNILSTSSYNPLELNTIGADRRELNLEQSCIKFTHLSINVTERRLENSSDIESFLTVLFY
jgi:hypothetical protein